jgi:hypothetical protein
MGWAPGRIAEGARAFPIGVPSVTCLTLHVFIAESLLDGRSAFSFGSGRDFKRLRCRIPLPTERATSIPASRRSTRSDRLDFRATQGTSASHRRCSSRRQRTTLANDGATLSVTDPLLLDQAEARTPPPRGSSPQRRARGRIERSEWRAWSRARATRRRSCFERRTRSHHQPARPAPYITAPMRSDPHGHRTRTRRPCPAASRLSAFLANATRSRRCRHPPPNAEAPRGSQEPVEHRRPVPSDLLAPSERSVGMRGLLALIVLLKASQKCL